MTIYNEKNCKVRSLLRNLKKIRELGYGSNGKVDFCINIINNKLVAIKTATKQETESSLKKEWEILRLLGSNGGTVGVPKPISFGEQNGCYFIIMELLGLSLQSMFEYCGRKFSEKKVLILAYESLEIIKRIHDKGIIHRDIKPDNFMLGLGQSMECLHIGDYGLSKQYRPSNTREHIPENKNYHFVGNMLFCSINAHLNKEQSRRDDLISIGYMLIYFLRGTLPWSKIFNEYLSEKSKSKKEEKRCELCECKLNTSIEELCKDCPEEFKTYMTYVLNLRFDEEPDYIKLIRLFRDEFIGEGYKFDNEFNEKIKESNERQQAREQQWESEQRLRDQRWQELQEIYQRQLEEEIRTVNNFDSHTESVTSDSSTQEQLYDCINSSEGHTIRHSNLNEHSFSIGKK